MNKSNPIREYFKSMIGKEPPDTAPAFSKWINGKITALDENSIEVEFLARDEFCNPLGSLHGGVQAAIMDEVTGMIVAAMDNEHLFVSVNLSVDFISNIRLGDSFKCRAEVIKKGKKIVNVCSQITDMKGRILSKASANMAATNLKTGF